MIRGHLAEDADSLQVFLDEARLDGRLNHPNVVHTLEVAEIDGSLSWSTSRDSPSPLSFGVLGTISLRFPSTFTYAAWLMLCKVSATGTIFSQSR